MTAPDTKRWSLPELHQLPEDVNRYEIVRGELFVTPAPSFAHETIAEILHSILEPYVKAHGLGRVSRPRAVVRVRPHSEVEPDLMVRPWHDDEVTTTGLTWQGGPAGAPLRIDVAAVFREALG